MSAVTIVALHPMEQGAKSALLSDGRKAMVMPKEAQLVQVGMSEPDISIVEKRNKHNAAYNVLLLPKAELAPAEVVPEVQPMTEVRGQTMRNPVLLELALKMAIHNAAIQSQPVTFADISEAVRVLKRLELELL